MQIIRKPFAFLGMFILSVAPIFLPYLRVPLKGNWNLYQVDVALCFLTYALLGLCVFAFFLRRVRFYKRCTQVFALWVVIAFAAVYFKINNYFGMKLVDGLLAKTIHLSWGWYVLALGALILLFSVKKVDAAKLTVEKN